MNSQSARATGLQITFRQLLAISLMMVGSFLFGRTAVQADEQTSSKLLQTFVDEFVAITPGQGKFPASFEMGSDEKVPNEKPVHTVKISRPFEIAIYEVPQNLYELVMGTNPSRWKGRRNSVEMMSWDDANEFCSKITQLLQTEKLIATDEIIRLPSEAEWEYCCRAGTSTRYSFGDNPQKDGDVSPKATILNQYGWHTGNAAGNDPAVGVLKPNPWGLYDMHGYLWEFTADAWSPNYQQAPVDGSAAIPGKDTKLIAIRSGSWKDPFSKLTSTARQSFDRGDKDDAVGFRCVKSKRQE